MIDGEPTHDDLAEPRSRRGILAKWWEWSAGRENLTSHHPLAFFGWLQGNHPQSLDFPYIGDPYQDVKCWIREADPRVRD